MQQSTSAILISLQQYRNRLAPEEGLLSLIVERAYSLFPLFLSHCQAEGNGKIHCSSFHRGICNLGRSPSSPRLDYLQALNRTSCHDLAIPTMLNSRFPQTTPSPSWATIVQALQQPLTQLALMLTEHLPSDIPYLVRGVEQGGLPHPAKAETPVVASQPAGNLERAHHCHPS